MNTQFEQALNHFRELLLKSSRGQHMTSKEHAFLNFGKQYLSPLKIQENKIVDQNQVISMHKVLFH